ILEFGAQVAAGVLFDPDLEGLVEGGRRDAANHLAGLLPVLVETDLLAGFPANQTPRWLGKERDARGQPPGLGSRSLFFRLRFLLLAGLDIGRMAVEFRVFERRSAGVIEDGEVALVDVLAESGSTPLHLLVEDAAAQRAREDDVFYIRGIEP